MNELNKLWKKRVDAKKVFPVTFLGFRDHYIEYCWISGPKYGLGFFLYKLKKQLAAPSAYYFKKIVHKKVNDKYAIWELKETDILQPLERIEEEYNDELHYKTTINLSVNDNSTLPKKSNFDWDHKQSAWIYTKEGQKKPYYKTTLNPELFS